MRLKIAVLNAQSGIGTTRGYLQYIYQIPKYYLSHSSAVFDHINRFIEEEKIDIIAFSEIDGGSSRTRSIDQNYLVQTGTRLSHYNFFPTFQLGTRINQGNAVHSRFKIQSSRNIELPGLGQPRYLGHSKIQLDGSVLNLLVTHLSLKLDMRRPQIDEIAKKLNSIKGPIVLAGDFNISKETELDILEKSRLQKVAAGKTFPSWRPAKCLDYIFLSPEFKVLDSYVYTKRKFSDHLPLVVDVQI